MLLLAREKEGDVKWQLILSDMQQIMGYRMQKLNYAKLLDEGKYTKKSTFSAFNDKSTAENGDLFFNCDWQSS